MTETIKGVSFELRVDDRIDLPGALASEVDVVMSTAPPHPGDSSSALALRGWLASGVPAIVPQGPGLVGLVQDGVDARVVAPHDRNAVVRAMLRLAEHSDLRNEMGHAAAARHAGRVRRPSLQVPAQGSGSFAAKSRAASR
jgi:glycosyltransferase involved in cell wall biosynthesis